MAFDAQVFESIVKKVIIGGMNKDGNMDPFKMTFVYKTGDHDDVESQKTENEKTAYVRQNRAHKKANGVTCRDCDTAPKKKQLEILCFSHFSPHVTFTVSSNDYRNKEIRNEIEISIVFEVNT